MGARLAAAASLTPLPDQDAVISYRLLRMLVGIIGFALPVVAVLGKLWLNGRGVESSISAYYYTHMRNYFVGSRGGPGHLRRGFPDLPHERDGLGRQGAPGLRQRLLRDPRLLRVPPLP